MAHFALINENNEVIRSIVISNDDCGGGNYPESEEIGKYFISNTLGLDGTWLQCSYSGSFRGRLACPGMLYLSDFDVFVYPKPYPSWVYDSALKDWKAPIDIPNDPTKEWLWNENHIKWDAIDIA